MAMAKWNRVITDDAGNVVDGATITVRSELTGNLAAIFSDRDGAMPLANPFVAADGADPGFYVSNGQYRVQAVLGPLSRDFRDEPIYSVTEGLSLTGSKTIGGSSSFTSDSTYRNAHVVVDTWNGGVSPQQSITVTLESAASAGDGTQIAFTKSMAGPGGAQAADHAGYVYIDDGSHVHYMNMPGDCIALRSNGLRWDFLFCGGLHTARSVPVGLHRTITTSTDTVTKGDGGKIIRCITTSGGGVGGNITMSLDAASTFKIGYHGSSFWFVNIADGQGWTVTIDAGSGGDINGEGRYYTMRRDREAVLFHTDGNQWFTYGSFNRPPDWETLTDATAGQVDNKNVAGYDEVIFTGGATITGLAGGYHGKIVRIKGRGFGVAIPHDNGSSSSGNRFYLPSAGSPGAITLSNGAVATFVYDSTSGYWHLDQPANTPISTFLAQTSAIAGLKSLQSRGSDIASASTVNLDNATGDIVDVTGTTTITAITLADGDEQWVRFTGALTLTNGASLVLPGGTNITTASGDFALFRGYGSSVVRCVSYTRASGEALVGGAGTPTSFKAHKNGTDQTGVADTTFTQVTFGTEVYDAGGHFASNAWTPPAGKVQMCFGVGLSGTIAAGNQILIAIYKNGSIFAVSNVASSANAGGGQCVAEDNANGSDAYTAYIYVDVTSSTATVSGQTFNTSFSGHVIN